MSNISNTNDIKNNSLKFERFNLQEKINLQERFKLKEVFQFDEIFFMSIGFIIGAGIYSTLGIVTKHAGNYNISWNAHNHSSGIYFVSMHTNGNHFIQKLMLVK